MASTQSMRRLPIAIAVFVAAMALMLSACDDEKKTLISGNINPDRFPTMRTVNVSTLISDSGVTRYKITSPLWLMFEEASVPQWKFPKGLHLEKYDDFFRKDATVDCDSAIFFKNKQLWRLDGYVKIANIASEKFLTTQLFWDQKQQKIYSDSFIHIEKSDRIIEGYGFESNEQMTNYRVRNVSGIFPVSDFKGGGTAAPDSTGASVAPATTTVQTAVPRHAPGADSTSRRSRSAVVPPSLAVPAAPKAQQPASSQLRPATQAAPAAAAPARRPGVQKPIQPPPPAKR